MGTDIRLRSRLGRWLRRLADRVDDAGAPKAIGWSFTFEHGRVVFRQDGKGCRLWYLGDADHQRAHAEQAAGAPLVWESAGTGEARDQNAVSVVGEHTYYSLGPTDEGRWGVELIYRDEDLEEIPELSFHLGHFESEEAAKAAAQTYEDEHGGKPELPAGGVGFLLLHDTGRYGRLTSLHSTVEKARRAMIEVLEEHWPDIVELPEVPDKMPTDAEEALAIYKLAREDEDLYYEPVTVEG